MVIKKHKSVGSGGRAVRLSPEITMPSLRNSSETEGDRMF